jgi:hypothetical protein
MAQVWHAQLAVLVILLWHALVHTRRLRSCMRHHSLVQDSATLATLATVQTAQIAPLQGTAASSAPASSAPVGSC